MGPAPKCCLTTSSRDSFMVIARYDTYRRGGWKACRGQLRSGSCCVLGQMAVEQMEERGFAMEALHLQ